MYIKRRQLIQSVREQKKFQKFLPKKISQFLKFLKFLVFEDKKATDLFRIVPRVP